MDTQIGRQCTEACPSWCDGQGAFYVLSDATTTTEPPPSCSYSSVPLPATSPIQKVHSAADRTATWQFGEAFLKVKDLNEQEARCTREHVTLACLHARGGWTTFDLPRVLYHGLWDNNRYVLLTTAVRGRTFGSWWPSMNEEMKNRCVNRVIEACKERLSGRAGGRSYTNDDLMAASKEMGMNCAVPFHFYHCDLGPGNIILDVKEGDDDGRSISIGIIDWEIAGFVPW
ncbi:hypothetical protein PG995_012580 [Apiospora arundinis]